jgi:uncharacterized membrane protein
MLKKLIWVFFISLLPVIELRGGIPTGYFLGLPLFPNVLVSVLGNLLPVPFILLFIPHVLNFMERHRIFPHLVGWIQRKAQRGAAKLQVSAEQKADEHHRFPWGSCLALYAFVAIPLPGTGAWTGALVAATFGMKRRYALPVILLGVVTAAVIISAIFYGGITALQKFF